MSNIEKQYRRATATTERDTFVSLVRQHPEMTLAELAELAKGKIKHLMASVTLGEVLGHPGHPVKGVGSEVGRRGGISKAASGETQAAIDTRSPAGRTAYDTAVLKALGGFKEAQSAPVLGAKVGGTPIQLRASLNRLIADGKVAWEGKARGTKYSAA